MAYRVCFGIEEVFVEITQYLNCVVRMIKPIEGFIRQNELLNYLNY